MSVINEIQQEKIRLLRQRGKTYQEIGDATGISMSTVKSFCRRKGITILPQAEPALPNLGFCLNCDKAVIQKEKQKPKKFCCPKCREMWWNKNRTLISRALQVVDCAYCGRAFEKYEKSSQRYCCRRCYVFDRFGEVTE